jgi:hypothetical protein
VLPKLPPKPDRIYFFDLADPEKRSVEDLRAALAAIAKFAQFGRVTLGLNLKEAQQVGPALGCAAPDDEEKSLRQSASDIRIVQLKHANAAGTGRRVRWSRGTSNSCPR